MFGCSIATAPAVHAAKAVHSSMVKGSAYDAPARVETPTPYPSLTTSLDHPIAAVAELCLCALRAPPIPLCVNLHTSTHCAYPQHISRRASWQPAAASQPARHHILPPTPSPTRTGRTFHMSIRSTTPLGAARFLLLPHHTITWQQHGSSTRGVGEAFKLLILWAFC